MSDGVILPGTGHLVATMATGAAGHVQQGIGTVKAGRILADQSGANAALALYGAQA